ncbi:MAG TPA: penicillin-binding protein 1C [Terriglobia bacterium]|nr:penicillin-binding protein 1C [Terriglobia bacterium]
MLLALAFLRFWPHASLSRLFPLSTNVWSADGELLRVTLAADGQYRLWTPLDEISPDLVKAFLLKEDRWFYWHPGVNPVALARAGIETARGRGRQGASTLTMQLARLTYRLNTRSVSGKIRQIIAALWLEARYSKREILEAYLNVAPFGGNIQGVGAATRIYLDKAPGNVTIAEALTLAVIPQRPQARVGAEQERALFEARSRLGRLWLARYGASDADRRQIDLPVGARRRELPFAFPPQAPHFVDALITPGRAQSGRIDTTLDASLQRLLERQIQLYISQHSDQGIRNATALLVDWRDASVKAWVGSADYWNADIDGQVNGVLAKRSPGSTLKPFVYGLALDQGILHPRTVLRDAPTAFGPFSPENFDGQFFGPISAEEALVRSRNVPAVWVSSQLRQPSLYEFLRTAGVSRMKSESYYGLALTLGGGEVTMEELTALYVMLASGGELRPLRTTLSLPASGGTRLLSPEASFITLDMLRHNPRPDGAGALPLRGQWPVAWKTGTSWGFRDAWSAGIAGPYALAVWIGDFEGQGNRSFVGADAAAPLFFRIVDALNLAQPADAFAWEAPPPGVEKVTVCAASGDLPNVSCPTTVDTWYIPGKSPIRVSQLHRAVAVDSRTGRPVCPPYSDTTRFDVYEFWPSDMLKLFRDAGAPRRLPPELPGCATEDSGDAPRIASPLRNVGYALRWSHPDEVIPLQAHVAADVQYVFWFDGNALITRTPVTQESFGWRPSRDGAHLIRVIDDHGRSAERDVQAQFGP